jgi:hypothetical protein
MAPDTPGPSLFWEAECVQQVSYVVAMGGKGKSVEGGVEHFLPIREYKVGSEERQLEHLFQ